MAGKRTHWSMSDTSVYDESESDLTPSSDTLNSQRETAVVACNDLLRLFGEKEISIVSSAKKRMSNKEER